MYSEAKKLPGDSRVWVYQASRKFTAEEENTIKEAGIQFVNGWTAHNKDLLGTFEIRHHLFLIFMSQFTLYNNWKNNLASHYSTE
jgi:hypothetical protein